MTAPDIGARLDRCEQIAEVVGIYTDDLAAELAALRIEITEMHATRLHAATTAQRRVTDIYHPAAGYGPDAS